MDPAAATIGAIAANAVATLVDAGHALPSARQDASVLARHLLGWDAAAWLTERHADASADFINAYSRLVARRARHEPVAYITGEREFYGRPFSVSPDVLIPRPETEDVVAAAIEILRAPTMRARGDSPDILDVGTGSGCLAITIALEVPSAAVEATDVSPAALARARGNATTLGVGTRINFRHTSLTGDAVGRFDVIVSNPPYRFPIDRSSLPSDVLDHEPALALFGGRDGLDVIRLLLPAAARALRDGGYVIVEIGAGQAREVEALVRQAGLEWVAARPDLAGIPRVIVARRPSASV